MKKAVKLTIDGTVQSMFFRQFIKEHADKYNVKGFIRNLENGKTEVFIEGNPDDVESMSAVCKRGPKYANIRSVQEKEERFQDFKEFKIMRI